jgi:hypothetical protein
MDDSGMKYLAWEECSPYTCRIVYTRYLMNQVGDFYYFEPGALHIYADPDIVVIDNGDVYLTWRELDKVLPDEPEGCYNIMTGGVPADTVCNDLYTRANYDLENPPLLATNGDEVYSVFEVVSNSSGSDLRYRQLRPSGAALRGWVAHDDSADETNTDPSLWVSMDGWLYVAWIHTDLTHDRIVEINDNYGDTDGGDLPYRLSSTTEGAESCAVVVDENGDYAYVVRGLEGAGSDMVSVSYYSVAHSGLPSSFLDANMPPTGHWEVRDHLSTISIDDHIYIGLSAYNDTTGGVGTDEIYGLGYQQGDTSLDVGEPFTDNDYVDLPPLIRAFDCPDCGSTVPIVTGWRVTESGSDFYWNFFLWTNKGFTSPAGSPGFPAFDMASDGQWVAALGIDYLSDSDTRQVPWLSFNVYGSNLPVITKP